MFEKIVNSKIYNIVDLIIKVIWVNLLMLITSVLGLFIFTGGTSILAGTYVIKLIYQKYEGPVLSIYFKAFKRFYKKSAVIFLIYSIAIGLLLFNVQFFIFQMEEQFTWFSFIYFMLSLIIGYMLFVSMFHSLLLSSTFGVSSIKDLIFNGVKLSFAFTGRGLLFFTLMFLILGLSVLIPVVIPLISFFLICISTEFVLFRAYNKIPMFDNVADKVAHELTL